MNAYIYVDKADVFGRIGCRFCDGMGRIFREQGAEDMISSRGMAFRCLFHKSSVWYGTAQFPLVRGGGGGLLVFPEDRKKEIKLIFFFVINKNKRQIALRYLLFMIQN